MYNFLLLHFEAGLIKSTNRASDQQAQSNLQLSLMSLFGSIERSFMLNLFELTCKKVSCTFFMNGLTPVWTCSLLQLAGITTMLRKIDEMK